MHLNKERIIIVALVVLLVVALGYIGYSRYTQGQAAAFNQGMQLGAQQAVVQIMQGAITCQTPVPLTYGNVTLHMVAAECIQAAQQQAAQQQAQEPSGSPSVQSAPSAQATK